MWQWRERYRWWGPTNGTDWYGQLLLKQASLIASADSVVTRLECDWGDCDGPLHGRHNLHRDGTLLIVTRPERVPLLQIGRTVNSVDSAHARALTLPRCIRSFARFRVAGAVRIHVSNRSLFKSLARAEARLAHSGDVSEPASGSGSYVSRHRRDRCC